MSTPKRPARFGDVTQPTVDPRGAPMPLVTQPMIPIPVDGDGDPAATRLDRPLATIKSDAAVRFGKPTQAMVTASRPSPRTAIPRSARSIGWVLIDRPPGLGIS